MSSPHPKALQRVLGQFLKAFGLIINEQDVGALSDFGMHLAKRSINIL